MITRTHFNVTNFVRVLGHALTFLSFWTTNIATYSSVALVLSADARSYHIPDIFSREKFSSLLKAMFLFG